jgi:hypothetical protein
MKFIVKFLIIQGCKNRGIQQLLTYILKYEGQSLFLILITKYKKNYTNRLVL